MSSGNASTTGPRLPEVATWNARATYSGMRSTESMRAAHLARIDFLERLAIAEIAAHVAHEKDHRRRVLERRMHTDRRLRGAGPARDEAQPRPVGELAVRLGHVRRARLLAAHHELQLVPHVVEPVQHGEEAFARHGEREVRAVRDQLVDEDAPAVALHSCFTT
jgi:hypothetical protein